MIAFKPFQQYLLPHSDLVYLEEFYDQSYRKLFDKLRKTPSVNSLLSIAVIAFSVNSVITLMVEWFLRKLHWLEYIVTH